MSASRKINFTLPPGRIVRGSPTFMQTEYKGVKKEKPTWFFAVAVPKTDPHIGAILQQIMQFAWQSYQGHQGVLQAISQGLQTQNFAWKIDDGDAGDNATKEGHAGHWIFKFSTSIGAPACFDPENRPMDPAAIKTGYWVLVACSIDINEQTDRTAGLYMNPNGVQFVAYGQEIRVGPSPDQMFGAPGQRQYALPPGASATPLAPGGAPGYGAPGAPGGAAAPAAPGFAGQPTAPGYGAPAAPGAFGISPPAGAPGYGAPAAPAAPGAAPGFAGQPTAPTAPGAPGAPGFAAPGAPGAPLGVGAPTAPGQSPAGAGSVATPASPATAYLSSEQLAAQHNVQHYPGYRFNPATRQYDPDQAASSPYPGATTVAPNHGWANGPAQ